MATVVVVIGAFAHHARQMNLPRTVVTRNPMGRPLGPPGDAAAQRAVMVAALRLVDEAVGPGEMVRLDGRYRPPRQGPPAT